jgi:hypothetical protein
MDFAAFVFFARQNKFAPIVHPYLLGDVWLEINRTVNPSIR